MADNGTYYYTRSEGWQRHNGGPQGDLNQGGGGGNRSRRSSNRNSNAAPPGKLACYEIDLAPYLHSCGTTKACTRL
jgi:hypothetical protein